MRKDRKYLDATLSPQIRTEDLINNLSLMDKIGQLNQIWGLEQMKEMGAPDPADMARQGLAGSMLYVLDIETKNYYQKLAIEESPSGIPILFGSDVVHGYKTAFPIPLAMASSWDTEVLECVQKIAAKEARADGIHWTFFPNADIARDSRWGRIGETMGEDPYLASKLVAAQVKGFQGQTLNSKNTLLSCVKHFAGYGAATGGRDYDAAFLPETELRNIYFPPFQAGLEAGAGTVMTAYMDLNNVPATVNSFLMKSVLRKEWGFQGVVVTDAGTIGSLVTQGFAKDRKEAAYCAIKSEINMDMGSCCYLEHLRNLVEEGFIKEKEIDDALRPILIAKFALGLFEQPYITTPTTEELKEFQEHGKVARWAAGRSIVLLKNENQLLPLPKSVKNIAVIGPLADAPDDMEGILGMNNIPQSVTVLQGIKNKLPHAQINYAPGPWIKREIQNIVSEFLPDFCGKKEKRNQTQEESKKAFAHAVETASKSDYIIMVLGETNDMSGEAASRSDISLPGEQEALLQEIASLGKSIVLILLGARPLAITWASEHIPAIIEGWQLGWEGGNALADVLFGDINPSGKLPVTFPRSAGQCPQYYAQNRSHVPVEEQKTPYSRYWNEESTPLYPFGYGLSYTSFAYGQLSVNKSTIRRGETVEITVTVENVGPVEGEEVAQLYLHQRYGSDSRPVRLLKGYERVSLTPGQTRTITFKLNPEDLTYWSTAKQVYVQEQAVYDVWVGSNSNAKLHTEFKVE